MQRTLDNRKLRMYGRLLLNLLPLGLTGCAASKVSSPAQTGIEQLLLSTAADRAVSGIKLDTLQGKQVFLSTQYLDCLRAQYVTGALREALGTAGAILTEKREDAEIIMEVRSAVLSIDESETFIGIPRISLGFPGNPALPEGALYKKTEQDALGRFSIYSYDRTHSSPALSLSSAGSAYYYRWRVLFLISFRTTDLERKWIVDR